MRHFSSVLVIILCSNLISYAQSSYILDSSYPIKTNGTLYLQTNDAIVNIQSGNTDVVQLKVERKIEGKKDNVDFKFEIENNNGDLYIKEHKKSDYYISWTKIITYKVDIIIPIDINLKLKGDDDDYQITGVNGDIQLNGEDGNVKISNCNSKNMLIHLEDGDLFINECNTSLNIRLDDGNLIGTACNLINSDIITEDGDISISGGTNSNIRVRTSDGDIVIDEGEGDFYVVSEDGDIHLNHIISNKLLVKTEDGDVYLSLDSQDFGNYEISSEDGDINLQLKGEAKIVIDSEDADINAKSNKFSYVTNEKHHKILRTSSNSTAQVRILIGDGDVSLNP